MHIPDGELDLLAIGETLVDFISVEESNSLRDAYTFRKYLGGSPANIAINVAKLNGRSAVISKTGSGPMGQFLKAELQKANVRSGYLVMDSRVHTTVVFVSRTKGTPDFEALRESDYNLEPEEIDEKAIEQTRVIHASTFALSREPCRSAVEKAFQLAHEQGKIISLDPNYSPLIWPDQQEAQDVVSRMLAYATITKPSLDDARRLFGDGKPPKSYIEQFHAMGPEVVVFTMGAQGAILSYQGRLTHIPARPISIADATGAGDAFWAGFLIALLDGNPLLRCVLFAREVAELKLTTVGPFQGTIDRYEIYRHIDELPPPFGAAS